MHNSISVTDDDEKKTEINIFYNETKGGVDCLDMLVHNYMSKRQTKRWSMSFFHHLVDVVGVAAFIVWSCQHPEWNAPKTNKRKLFLKDLGEKLVDAEISRRIQKRHLRKKSRAVIEQMGYGILFNKLWQILLIHQMNLCPKGRDATCVPTVRIKSRQVCHKCQRNVCGEHSVSTKSSA